MEIIIPPNALKMNVSDIFPAGFQQRAHSRGSPDNLGNSATKLGLPPTNNQQLKT
jgi:hypothetical protein